LELEIEELKLKKELHELKLERNHAEKKDYLTKTERQDFNSREDAIDLKIDDNKEKQKLARKGEYSTGEEDVESDEKEVEGTEDEDEESNIYSIIREDEISDMSTVGLKARKAKLNGKKGQLNAKLKVKSGVMKESKKDRIEADVKLIEYLVTKIDEELANRKEETEKETESEE